MKHLYEIKKYQNMNDTCLVWNGWQDAASRMAKHKTLPWKLQAGSFHPPCACCRPLVGSPLIKENSKKSIENQLWQWLTIHDHGDEKLWQTSHKKKNSNKIPHEASGYVSPNQAHQTPLRAPMVWSQRYSRVLASRSSGKSAWPRFGFCVWSTDFPCAN